MTVNASKTKVLIVGAGAMGLTLGYELHLAGAQIAFLVRSKRAPELARPQILYSYDDTSLKTFTDFEVIAAPAEVPGLSPDYVIVTLDGAATREPEGTALLAALGNAIGKTSAVMIGGGVGVDLRQHYLAATGLPSERVMMGVLGSFAYQVDRADLPLHPPTDPAVLARADIAYRHYSTNGLLLEGRFAHVAKRFAALYNRNGLATCSILEPHLYEIMTNVPFPIYAGSELLGWRPASEMAKNKSVWRLIASAVRETARLDRRGWRGKLAGLLLTDWMIARMWSTIDKKSLPLDHQAFNEFMHGGKVVVQDMAIMQKCVAAGEAERKPMTALKELLRRVDMARADGTHSS